VSDVLDDGFVRHFCPGRQQGKGAHAGAAAVPVGVAIQDQRLDGRQVPVAHRREDPRAVLGDDVAGDRERLMVR
jgi:hypothetical protein